MCDMFLLVSDLVVHVVILLFDVLVSDLVVHVVILLFDVLIILGNFALLPALLLLLSSKLVLVLLHKHVHHMISVTAMCMKLEIARHGQKQMVKQQELQH